MTRVYYVCLLGAEEGTDFVLVHSQSRKFLPQCLTKIGVIVSLVFNTIIVFFVVTLQSLVFLSRKA